MRPADKFVASPRLVSIAIPSPEAWRDRLAEASLFAVTAAALMSAFWLSLGVTL